MSRLNLDFLQPRDGTAVIVTVATETDMDLLCKIAQKYGFFALSVRNGAIPTIGNLSSLYVHAIREGEIGRPHVPKTGCIMTVAVDRIWGSNFVVLKTGGYGEEVMRIMFEYAKEKEDAGRS